MEFNGSSLTINFHSSLPKVVEDRARNKLPIDSNVPKPPLYDQVSRKRKASVRNPQPSVYVGVEGTDKSLVVSTSKPSQNNNNPRKYRPLINAIKEAEKLTTPTKNRTIAKPVDSVVNCALFDEHIDLDGFTDIDERLRNALKSYLKSSQLTVVQKLSWPTISKGANTLIKSPSGSGKTLAFLVPIIDCLLKQDPKIKRQDGVFALVLVPTKELAKQIADILTMICRNFVWIVPGGLYGCDKRKAEKSRLRKGLNIVVATPGRLHDHLVHTKCLDLSNLKWFVVDEADLLLEMGYDQKFQEIKNCIPAQVLDGCQKIFLSATLSTKFIAFFSHLFQENTYFVDASKQTVTLENNISHLETNALVDTNVTNEFNHNGATAINSVEFDYPTNLKQLVVEIPTKLRLIALVWTLKYIVGVKNKNTRVIVFFSSIASAEFHCQLFQAIDRHVIGPSSPSNNFKYLLLHGSMEIKERIHVYELFSKHNRCILFTTDVAARGLDFPCVDWIIQFNPARELKEYVHRVGRTCRIGNNGSALLFLEPHEMSYMDLLYKSHLSIEHLNIYSLYQKISANMKKLEDDATVLFKTIRDAVSADGLHSLALRAYNSAVKAYTSYPRGFKQIFCLKTLHQGHLAESFAIRERPTAISKQISPNETKPSLYSRKIKQTNFKVRVPKSTPKNSIRSASSLLLDEFNGGIVSGPSTRKSKR